MPSHQEEKDSREHAEHENANNPAGLKHPKDVVLGCWADRSTFAFEDARDAAAMFAGPHSPGGKLALVPGA
jgi:hypothetical protein